MNNPLIDDLAAGYLAQNHDRMVSEFDGNQTALNELVVFFSDHLNKLQQAIAASPKPAISSITLDVFGFSRGAAEAVAFSHLFNDLLGGQKFASIPASINFWVCSIWLSRSASLPRYSDLYQLPIASRMDICRGRGASWIRCHPAYEQDAISSLPMSRG